MLLSVTGLPEGSSLLCTAKPAMAISPGCPHGNSNKKASPVKMNSCSIQIENCRKNRAGFYPHRCKPVALCPELLLLLQPCSRAEGEREGEPPTLY
jgi:hypothetical protein